MTRLRPIDDSLEVSDDRARSGVGEDEARDGSLEAYHTPRSRSPRLRRWDRLLPGREHLLWAALCLVMVGIWRHAPRAVHVEPADRALLPTAEPLAALSGAFAFDSTAEQLDKVRGWDGATTLRYRYVPADLREPRIKALCWAEGSPEAAREAFGKSSLNTVFDWRIGADEPVGLVELFADDAFGDESRVWRVELEGRVLGYGLTLRVGRRVAYAKIERVLLSPRILEAVATELERSLSRAARTDL